MENSPFIFPVERLDREYLAEAKERSRRSEADDLPFLREFGLADEVDDKELCTLEAVLLFASENRRVYHSRAGIRVFSVDGLDRDIDDEDRITMRQFDGPIMDMLEQVFEYMPTVIRKSTKLFSLFFREMPEYPTDAWREFIINAVAHRDYGVGGSEIEIWIFEDRIEIESPGGLYNGIALESLSKRSFAHSSRNPRLVDVFSACGLMTETGKGINNAMKIMKKSYLNPPEFVETDIGFKVTMQNSPVFDVGDPDWEEKVRKLDLNLNQKRILIINKGYAFSNSDYQQINNCDRDTAYREIHEIVEKGYIRCEGKGRGLKYYPQVD
ncbi:ATP-binding protein [Planctomycetota bacterium]